MTPAGFPHSGIHGSLPAFGFPWLFVDRYALLRLPVPRHPPCALVSLTCPSASSPKYFNHARITFGFSLAIRLPCSSTNVSINFKTSYTPQLCAGLSCFTYFFLYSVFKVHTWLFAGSRCSPSGGLKWTRTIDLTLIRRAL